MDHEDVKLELARRLHIAVDRVDPDIWTQLVEDREVDTVLEERQELDRAAAEDKREWIAEEKDEWEEILEAIAKRYRKYARFANRKRARRERSEAPRDEVVISTTDARLDALAEILALDAGRLLEVRAVRDDLLGGELLKPQDVPAWIDDVDAREGEGSEGAILRDTRPAGQGPGRLLVRPGGELDRLGVLVDSLASAYGWEEPDAVNFVLAGTTPSLTRASVTIRYRSPYAALSRIVIDTDSRTPPREITRLYSQARLKLRKGADRQITDRHLALAVFVAKEMGKFAPGGVSISYVRPVRAATGSGARIQGAIFDVPPDAVEPSWRELLTMWNRQYPKWAYATRSPVEHFGNDARIAWTRVTGVPWAPPNDAEDARDAPGEEP